MWCGSRLTLTLTLSLEVLEIGTQNVVWKSLLTVKRQGRSTLAHHAGMDDHTVLLDEGRLGIGQGGEVRWEPAGFE